jgi:hypothetical protein
MIATHPDILPSIAAWHLNRDPDIGSAERRARIDLKYHQKYLLEWREERHHWPAWYRKQEQQRRLFHCQWSREIAARIRVIEGK